MKIRPTSLLTCFQAALNEPGWGSSVNTTGRRLRDGIVSSEADKIKTTRESECLHCELMKVIEEYVSRRQESSQEPNAADIANKIVEALSQFILDAVPQEERAMMIAHALESFGRMLQMDGNTDTLH